MKVVNVDESETSITVEKSVSIKYILEVTESILKILGIVFVVIWFLLQGEPLQRGNITQKILKYKINDKYNLLHISVTLRNTGKVKIKVNNGVIRVQQIRPILSSMTSVVNKSSVLIPFTTSKTYFGWPYTHKYFIKPGAVIRAGEEEAYSYQVILPKEIELVQVYTHIKESKKLGWAADTIFDLKGARNAQND